MGLPIVVKSQEEFVNINNVPIHVRTWGRSLNDPLEDVRELIVFIPGMVGGLPNFYITMLSTLFLSLNGEVPIWIVGQAGHAEPKPTTNAFVLPLKGNEILYDINGQVRSKVEFLKEYVPSNVKVHLVAHSLGTWMTLKILKQYPEVKILFQKCYLLFPTIRGTEDGKNINCKISEIIFWIYDHFRFIVVFFAKLPYCVKAVLFSIAFWISSVDREHVNPAIAFSKPSILDKCVFLSKEAVETLRYTVMDVELLEKHKRLLKLYYGATDGWVPLRAFREIKWAIPDIDAEIDTYEIEHSIVFKSSVLMGNILGKMVKENML
ncbi:C2orf43.2 family protein [Megaselia abdita]